MEFEGYAGYKKREFCNAVRCPIQMIMNKKDETSEDYAELRALCKRKCIHTTYEFHHWLIDNGYLLVRPKSS